MIKDEDIERALDVLRDTRSEAAQARANRIYMEEYRKVIKAQVMSENLELPIGAQEREAYSSERYKEHLLAIKEAIELDEKFRFLREAANAKIDAWRTMQANMRIEGKI